MKKRWCRKLQPFQTQSSICLCEWCSVEFEPTHGRGSAQRYCSIKCRYAASRSRKGIQVGRKTRPCVKCGKSFSTHVTKRKFCSPDCGRVKATPRPVVSEEQRTSQQRAKGRSRYAVGTAWITAYFANNPCVDCGEADRDVLEFDHRNPALKKGSVCEMAHRCVSRAEVEAAKCDVRCANCHRRRHARERRLNALRKANLVLSHN